MMRFLACLSLLAAVATSAQAQQSDQGYDEPYAADVALSEGEYDGNLASMAAADGVGHGHANLEYYKGSGSNPLMRGCYPTWTWNPYTGQWTYGFAAGSWISVTSGSLNSYIVGILGAQNAASTIFGRIGRGAWPTGC